MVGDVKLYHFTGLEEGASIAREGLRPMKHPSAAQREALRAQGRKLR